MENRFNSLHTIAIDLFVEKHSTIVDSPFKTLTLLKYISILYGCSIDGREESSGSADSKVWSTVLDMNVISITDVILIEKKSFYLT